MDISSYYNSIVWMIAVLVTVSGIIFKVFFFYVQPSSKTLHCCFTIRVVGLMYFSEMEPHGWFLRCILCIDWERGSAKDKKLIFTVSRKQNYSDYVNRKPSIEPNGVVTPSDHTAVHEWDQYQWREADSLPDNRERMPLMHTMTRQDIKKQP